MSEVGSGQVAVFPTFKGFRSSVNSEAAGAGREGGKTFNSAFNAGAGDPGAALVKRLNAQVASGAKALSAARLAEQDATGKVRVAEAALNEARAKGGEGSARAIAAEERLATAKRKLADASGRTKVASDQLRESQSRLAEATAAAGSSGEEAASRYARGWQGLKQRLSGLVKGSVDEAGKSAEASADKSGRSAGSAFGSGFKALLGPAMALAGGIGFAGLISEAARASDATDKFKATMNFAGLDTSAISDATAAAKEFADQTVYDLPTIQNTIAQLASNGVQDYTGLTKAAGNLNAVAGGNADTFKSVAMVMTQTAGAGKLTTENWNQLADAIPGAAGPLMKSLEEAGAYTGNFRDAMADGQITSEEFNAALMKLGNDPVAVEAAKSTKTFEGALGNLEATVNSGLMSALDRLKPSITGVINLMSNGLGKAFEFTGKAASGLYDLFAKGDFTGNLREAFKVEEDSKFVDGLFRTRDAAMQLWAGLSMGSDVRAQFAGQLDGVVAFGAGARAVFDEVKGGLRAMVEAFKAGDGDITSSGFAGFLEQVGGTVRAVFDALAPAVSAIFPMLAGLVPVLLQLFQALSPTSLIFQALLPVLPQIAATVGMLLTTFLGLAMSLASQLLPIITTLVGNILPPLTVIFGEIVTAIVPLVTMIAGVLVPVIQALMPVIVTVFSVIADVITSAMQIVLGIIQVVTGIISGDWAQVWTGIQNIFAGIWNTIVSVVRGALQIVGQAVISGLQLVGNFVGSILGSVGRFFADTWSNIISGTSGFVGNLIGFFTSLPGRIMGALAGAGSWLFSVGQNIVQGLIDGASGMVGRAVQAIKDVGGAMLDGVKGFLGIKSPSRRFRYEVGQQVGEGARLGILDKVKATAEAAKQLVTVPTVPLAAGAEGIASAAGLTRGASQVNHFTLNQVDDLVGTATAVARRIRSVSV